MKVRSGEVELAVRVRGTSGPVVVLVHGYPDTQAVWDRVAALLEEDFRVVTYDVRGAGESTAPSTEDGYRLEHLARDLFAVIDAVSPDEPVHLVGHDWGSVQSWEAVTTPGARIATFTSISGPCLDHMGHWSRRGLSVAHVRQFLRSWYIGAFHLPVLPALFWRLYLAPRWGDFLRRLEGVRATPAPTLASDAVRGISLYRANIRQVMRAPRHRVAPMPVQVVQPTRDHYVRTEPLPLERWVPRLRRRRITAGHWAPLSHPAPLARMISEFVEDSAPPRELAVITGGGSGIGRATALAFAGAGARVVVSDVDLPGAEETARLAGGHAYQVDVRSEEAVRAWARQVADEHGVPDVVVNNAGIAHAGSFLSTTTQQWQRVLDVNLWGVVHGCRAFGELMVERGEGGHIVNLSSVAAYLPSKILSAYATSKAAVFMLSECLRAELEPHAIGVTAVCPGIVATNITATATFSGVSADEERRKQDRASRIYARRGFGPEGVAAEIVRAVRRNRPVVPVTVEAKAARLAGRVAPGLLRAFARLDPS
ncbi:NADP-dependent 3-hydroxy acid dehydrogenase YdfG [Lentzea xinjiangensis]|uniref:NADP-dependent 3-hydroxy acid dehydrogenase YdfG n=1 Tax=Lentzea xinjiangensis TaxID=402600 RepID=A0A1H9M005_9PSEU|nr:SDR family oxidoreductase [Lentzea xinjiangensis]SER16775.1 NADP-dependent 3-hydroxy acid dehydrogenase YdfG [Lentzea xinjiangensis]